ncbi:MAG TPA: hypothetical protein VHN99_09220, partial [Deinococcales bacterium]|nr:hypothetical protein [Deinococcales bacterium]
EIWLIHHSHTDIGYTHPQPIVFELHRRYLDEVLDLIEATADLPDEARFRWTCESAGIAWDWWKQASPADRERFAAAERAGRLEVAALRWNMTPLADHARLATLLREAEALRAEGLTVRSAMQSDVDGLPWGAVRLLLDHGITGLTMAINEHFGRAASPRPGAFWWSAPDGGRLLVWNGPHYHSTPNRAMGIAGPLDAAIQGTGAYLAELDRRGYPLSILGLQPTNLYFSDNDAPDANLPRFVQDWNASGQPVKMRLATVSQFLDRLRREPAGAIPTQAGDWTDWWNFGAGSTALETRLHAQGQRDLALAGQVRAWTGATPRFETLEAEADAALNLYAEHTWGADWHAATRESDETAIQLGHKLEYAHRGASLARYLKRDALYQLARRLPGDGPSLLAYNPLPTPVRTMLRVPENAAGYAPDMAHLAQRFDVEWNGRQGRERWIGPVDLPALGQRVLPLDGPAAAPEVQGLTGGDGWISNGRVRAAVHPAGGLASLTLDGREFARPGEPLGRLVLEAPDPAVRSTIFGPPPWLAFDMHDAWHSEWTARRDFPLVGGIVARLESGVAELEQTLSWPNGETASVTYRLHPEEAALRVLVTLHLKADPAPRATYLNLPLALDGQASAHFETAGALVEFDREQLPGSSRHFVTTLNWLRLQDAGWGVSVATPDAPLWQIGGYTFGRFQGEGPAPFEPTLNAWLTNNYWDTNFKADQSGELRYAFALALHPAEGLADSAARARALVAPPEVQVFTGRPENGAPAASLVGLDLGGALLTGSEWNPGTRELALQVLNPDGQPRALRVAAGQLRPRGATLRGLAGGELQASEPDGEGFRLTLPARAWAAVVVRTE